MKSKAIVFILFLLTGGLLAGTGYAGVDEVRQILSNRLIEDEIIVKTSSLTAARASASAVRGRVVKSIARKQLHLVKLPRGVKASDAIAQIKASGAAQNAYQNVRVWIPENSKVSKPVKLGSAPPPAATDPPPPTRTMPRTSTGTAGPSASHVTNDPLMGYQWYLAKTRELIATNGFQAGAPIVAVLDTGVFPNAEMTDKLLPGFDFVNMDDSPLDDNGHGTHVAGIIAAAVDNNTGIQGIIPTTQILPVKVLDATGNGTWFNVVQGLEYADQQIDLLGGAAGTKGIINMSLGGYLDPNDDAFIDGSALLQSLAANNKLIVVSAGNENDEPYTFCQANPEDPSCQGFLMPFPAGAQPHVFSVAASDPNDYRAWFSNSSLAYTNIVAPGRFILSTVSTSYEALDGTSMAAPMVAAAAARNWAIFPTRNPVQIRNGLLSSGTSLSTVRGWPAGLRRLDIARGTSLVTQGFVGYAVNPSTGYWDALNTGGAFQPISRVNVSITNNLTAATVNVSTNESGFFIVRNLAASTPHTLTFTRAGYAPQTFTATTGSSVLTDVGPVFMNTLKPAVAPFEEVMVNLIWNSAEPFGAACGIDPTPANCTNPALGNRGAELDLYVQRPDTLVISFNELGDQFGSFTRDSFTDFMPGEGIYIKNLQTDPVGIYTIAVNRFQWGTMANVQARILLTQGTTASTTFNVPGTCTQDWWVVATIDPSTIPATVTPINTCQDLAPF